MSATFYAGRSGGGLDITGPANHAQPSKQWVNGDTSNRAYRNRRGRGVSAQQKATNALTVYPPRFVAHDQDLEQRQTYLNFVNTGISDEGGPFQVRQLAESIALAQQKGTWGVPVNEQYDYSQTTLDTVTPEANVFGEVPPHEEISSEENRTARTVQFAEDTKLFHEEVFNRADDVQTEADRFAARNPTSAATVAQYMQRLPLTVVRQLPVDAHGYTGGYTDPTIAAQEEIDEKNDAHMRELRATANFAPTVQPGHTNVNTQISGTVVQRGTVTHAREAEKVFESTDAPTVGGGEIDTADDNQRRQVMGSSSGAVLNWRTGTARSSEQLPSGRS
jgi:hypothetical protein